MNPYSLTPYTATAYPMPQNIQVRLTPIENWPERFSAFFGIQEWALSILRAFNLTNFLPSVENGEVQLLTHNLFKKSEFVTNIAKLADTSVQEFQRNQAYTSFIFANDVLSCPAVKDVYDRVISSGKVLVDFTEELKASFAKYTNGDLHLQVGTQNKLRIAHNFVGALVEADLHLDPNSKSAQFYKQFQNGTRISGIDVMEKTAELNTDRLLKVKNLFESCKGSWKHFTSSDVENEIQHIQNEVKPSEGHRFLQQLYYGDLDAPLKEWNALYREEYCQDNKYKAICSDVFDISGAEELNLNAWYQLVKDKNVHSKPIQSYLDQAFGKCLPSFSVMDCLKASFKGRN